MKMSQSVSIRLHAVLVCALVGFSVIKNGVLNVIRGFVTIPYKLDNIIFYAVLMVIILLLIRFFFQNLDFRELIPFLLILVMLIYSFISNFSYNSYYLRVISEYLLGVCGYVVIRTIIDSDLVLQYLRVTAFIITLCCLVAMGYSFANRTYSQSLGYHILPSVVISFDAILDKKAKLKILHFLNFFVAFLVCFMSGARGPIIAVAVFVVLRLLFGFGADRKRQVLYLFITAVVVSLVFIYFDKIFESLYELASKLGFSTRVFGKFEKGELFSATGRENFINLSLDSVNSSVRNFLFGTGIGKDRIILAKSFNAADNVYAYYSHNLFVEFIMQYGVILGVLLSLFVVFIILESLFSNVDMDVKRFFILFLGIGFVPLMFSMSYVTEPLFFCMIGAAVNCLENLSYKKRLTLNR